MIVNACIFKHVMVDEHECRECSQQGCRRAGEPTTQERLDEYTYGYYDMEDE